MRSLLTLFFKLLYHQFAWTYDLVAAVVSLGHWQSWVESALPYLDGRVLEVGFGPGHLQLALQERGSATFGLDESPQMVRLANLRLSKKGFPANITLGKAQRLPFGEDAFTCVVATFPSEYIFDADSLGEIKRVLAPGGKLVIVPSAWITGNTAPERLAAGLFRLTGQGAELEAVLPSIERRFTAAGFVVTHALVEQPGSRVLVIMGSKETGSMV